ncbi:peroxide stress protein YaaA [Maritimibacter sp. UBA3975]|uniref:peroxide stress protein YaaA n=1 Tax=Maritimibacter sp. UBA3975 TaxID=1946833 RepID=UPI000C0B2F58|nr:peroxide stress protein YaaA [Maritimibacter sp. UBA3975]MAM63665.1 hypothetical protein [Maritimibacter sp.]|tara:strand:+ start:16100 stop:16876 length:777 start_codon:yes stop_codon:yes gene_type:complete
MLITVSPAKRLDESDAVATGGTTPVFAEETAKLAKTAVLKQPTKLQALMDISPALGKLNAERFKRFGTGEGAKQAIEMFAGDTYTGFDAGSLDADAMDYAQDHLRILSGLYGLLRPRDVIEPHRLEMGTRLKTRRGTSLYDFWGDRIAKQLVAEAEALGTDTLVNCASVEYFTAADRKPLALTVVTPVFYETKAGEPKIVSFFAKQARGTMARFICENRISTPAGLADFTSGGYRYQPAMSTPERPVFQRAEDSQDAA